MTTKFLDALASEKAHNAKLLKVIYLVVALGAFGMYLNHSLPKHIELHLAPDPKAGDTIEATNGLTPVPPVNVYGFGYYIWQQINRWQADGSKDYGRQIYDFQAYLTPRCQSQLQADMDNRFKKGELVQRTRNITEIPGFPFSANRVVPDGPSAWTVLLDMQVLEEFRGQSIKDVYIRYPLRIVRYDVDRERNPWRLALDCFGGNRPARLDQRDIQARQMPSAPAGIAPAVLPRTTDQAVDPVPAGELRATPMESPVSNTRTQ